MTPQSNGDITILYIPHTHTHTYLLVISLQWSAKSSPGSLLPLAVVSVHPEDKRIMSPLDDVRDGEEGEGGGRGRGRREGEEGDCTCTSIPQIPGNVCVLQ